MSVPSPPIAIRSLPLSDRPRINTAPRLVLLMAALLTACAAVAYDFAFAKPAVGSAAKKIIELIDTRTRLSVDQGGCITPTDVHQSLGSKPTWTERHPHDDYVVEYYCWWGYLPLVNLRRHYLAVVYEGTGTQLVFSSYDVNRRPAREALPMPFIEKRPVAMLTLNPETIPQKDRPILRRPVAAVWIQSERMLAIANARSGSISIVDFPRRRVVDEIVVGERLADLIGHPAGHWFFAVEPQRNELIVLTRADDSLAVAERYRVGAYPVSIAASPDGTFISVSSQWSRMLSVFEFRADGDTCDLKHFADISVPFNPREQGFIAERVIAVNDAFRQRSCEVNIVTQAVAIRNGESIASPDPSQRLIKGIEARSEVRGGQERILGADFAMILGPTPALTAEDRGEDLFVSRKLSPSGQSCHDCHPFGHTTFELADTLADGTTGTPKRILTLLGTHQTYPWAWNGSVNELDDQVRKSLETTLHVRNVTAQQVIDINSFLHTLSPPPALEPSTDAPGDRARLLLGQTLFQELDCVKCHVPAFTYTSGEVFDVGFADEKGLRLFNPPSLLGVSQGYSFFHDGRAKTLNEIFTVYGHQLSRELTDSELADLLRFLRSL